MKQNAEELDLERTEADWTTIRNCLVQRAREGKTREQALTACAGA